MCGINGILSKTPIDPPDLIDRMNRAVIHRGPDGEGFFRSPLVNLGMRRLSIIDLSTGDQPMYNEDKSMVIVFNGEIYNYRELRSELKSRGHVFTTSSDTEVVLHLFEEKREECVCDLQGMFAFAIYDTKRHELFCARDRLGKKPLYYTTVGDRFIFASEIKSIMAADSSQRRIDPRALAAYFSLTFIPAPLTIYQSIRKLEAGHWLKVNANLGIQTHCYWDLGSTAAHAGRFFNPKACRSEIKEILCDAVRQRMIADVPLGVFLSGGVDSSIIVSIMSELTQAPIKTFSIANEVKAYDESEKAREVASLFKTEHVECRISNEQICDVAEKTICNFDEPFADSSALPSYVVSALAEKHVKVVLTGDGGDELFAGYTRYKVFRYLDYYSKIPSWVRNGIIKHAINTFPDFTGAASGLHKLRKLASMNTGSAFDAYHSLQCLGFAPETLRNILANHADFDSTRNLALSAFGTLASRSNLDKALFADIEIGLEGDMLAKLDRASMLASVETRCPFLDHRLVEFSFSIPPQLKMRGNRLKAILKDTFEDRFPKGFFDKPKMGFGVPVGRFIRTVFASRLKGLLETGPLHDSGIINLGYASQLVEEHNRGIDHTFQLWSIFAFGLWLEKNDGRVTL